MKHWQQYNEIERLQLIDIAIRREDRFAISSASKN